MWHKRYVNKDLRIFWCIRGEIRGVSFGNGGSSKRMVEGGLVKSHRFLFFPFLKYLTRWRYVLQTCYVDENHYFLTYSAKIPCFLAKNWFLLIFTYIFNASKISEGALTLWHHSDVIWSSMVLILVSIDRGGPYLYTVSKYKGIRSSV